MHRPGGMGAEGVSEIILFGRLADGASKGARFVAQAEPTDANVQLATRADGGFIGWAGRVSTDADGQATFVPDAPPAARL